MVIRLPCGPPLVCRENVFREPSEGAPRPPTASILQAKLLRDGGISGDFVVKDGTSTVCDVAPRHPRPASRPRR